MKISLVFAEAQKQQWLEREVGEGTTVQQAIEASGLLGIFPEIDLSENKIGIFGRVVKLDSLVSEGDRIEIYRPITADPETVERRDE